MKIICAKCNGVGAITHYSNGGTWSCTWYERCKYCDGSGVLKDIIIDDVTIGDEMIYITKKEYNELLEYKDMYERLCK